MSVTEQYLDLIGVRERDGEIEFAVAIEIGDHGIVDILSGQRERRPSRECAVAVAEQNVQIGQRSEAAVDRDGEVELTIAVKVGYRDRLRERIRCGITGIHEAYSVSARCLRGGTHVSSAYCGQDSQRERKSCGPAILHELNIPLGRREYKSIMTPKQEPKTAGCNFHVQLSARHDDRMGRSDRLPI